MTGEAIVPPQYLDAFRGVLGRPPRRGRVISWFAGCGLQSLAIRHALGQDPDAALNHNAVVGGMHKVNFPGTEFFLADVDEIDPDIVYPGEEIDFGWFSPDCTHHSRASGKAIKSERRRGLAWAVVKWAVKRRPKVMIVENVPEFRSWGPLFPEGHPKEGQPDPAHAGEEFDAWIAAFWDAGATAVEHRVLNAADYGGDPQTRERLFVVIRFDGRPVEWLANEYAPRQRARRLGLKPRRAAWECIDFTRPCPSIFMTQAEAKAEGLKIKRPLARATMKRAFRGTDRHVVNCRDGSRPFLVKITQRNWGKDRAQSTIEAMPVVTTANGGEFAVVAPSMVPLTHQGDARVYDLVDSGPTVTGANRGELALTEAQLAFVSSYHGQKADTDVRGADCGDALSTADGSNRHAVVAVSVTKFRGGSAGGDMREAMPTATANSYIKRPGGAPPLGVVEAELQAVSLQRQFGGSVGSGGADAVGSVMAGGGGKTQLLAVHLDRQFGSAVSGRDLRETHPTVMAGGGKGGCKSNLVAASLQSYYDTGIGSGLGEAMRTGTSRARHALHVAWLAQANEGRVGHGADEALSTLVQKCCTQQLVQARLELEGGPVGRRDRVLAFLWEHAGVPTQAEWDDPLGTPEARLKFGLVILPPTPSREGEGDRAAVEGADAPQVWMITDIGLRMLQPPELLRAMGVEDSDGFNISVDADGRPVSKTEQIHAIGNGVCRRTATKLIAANNPRLPLGGEAVAA